MGDHFGDKLFQQSGAVVSGAESKDGFGVARMENRIGVLLAQGSVKNTATTGSMINRVRNGRNALLLVPWPGFSVWLSRATTSLLYGR